jgi:hypothetical protein
VSATAFSNHELLFDAAQLLRAGCCALWESVWLARKVGAPAIGRHIVNAIAYCRHISDPKRAWFQGLQRPGHGVPRGVHSRKEEQPRFSCQLLVGQWQPWGQQQHKQGVLGLCKNQRSLTYNFSSWERSHIM